MADAVDLVIRPVVWTLLLSCGAWLAGYRCYRSALFSPDDSNLEWLTYPTLIGFCLFGAGVFIVGHLGLLDAVAIRIVLGVLGAIGAVRIFVRFKAERRLEWRRPDLIVLLAAAFALAHLPTAFDPSMRWDTVSYHLALPSFYLASSSLTAIPYHLTANMPHNLELLFTLAFAGAEITAARLMSFQLDLFVLVLLLGLCRRLGVAYLGGPVCVLYVTAPVISSGIASNYTEAAIGTYLLLALAVLLRFRDSAKRSQLLLFGGLIGWIMGCKYIAWYFAASLFVCCIAIICRKRDEPWSHRLASTSIAAAAVAAAILPWLVRALVLTGNPIFPNLHSVFDGRWWSPVLAMQLFRKFSFHGILGEAQQGSLEAAFRLPWDLVMNAKLIYNPEAFSAAAMVLFLLVVPLAWRARGPWVTVCIAPWLAFVVFCTLPVPNEGRYLVPLIPMMTLAAAFPLHLATKNGRPRRLLLTALIAACATQAVLPGFDRSVFHRDGYQKRLAKNRGYWATRLNAELPEDARVLFLFENAVFFLERDYQLDSLFEAPTSMEILRTAGSAAAAAEALRQAGITHLVINHFNARSYLKQDFRFVTLTDPVLLPETEFEHESQMLRALLRTESRHLLSLRGGTVEVFELGTRSPSR